MIILKASNMMKSNLRAVIHQPNFLPRLKVLQKIAAADIWVVLDSVQYCEREWQNRARLVASHGSNNSYWLSVPVHRPNGQETLIKDVTLVDPNKSVRLIKNTLFHAFRRSPYWNTINNFINKIASKFVPMSLTSLCVNTTSELLKLVGLKPTIVFSSALSVTGKASALMADICKHIHTNIYLADSGARNYLKPEYFEDINVLWQDWHEPKEKWHGIDSWWNISCLNYLCRVGPERFKNHVIKSRFKTRDDWQRLSHYHNNVRI
jgi:hypothetical protein